MNAVRPQPLAALARDALFVALAAIATVHSLRLRVGDRYLVPTGSMEPVLHGHAEDGDVVYVDKLADGSALRRRDLAVVAHPSDPGQLLVKRIAARGDDGDSCWIDLRQGDIWLGPDAQRLQREQKDPIAARGMRATWAASAGSAAARDGLDLRAADGGMALVSLGSLATAQAQLRREARSGRRQRDGAPLPDGCVGAARPVDAGCVLVDGARSAVGADVPVADAGMAVAFAALQGDLLLTLETRHEALTWRVQPAANKVALWRDGELLREFDLPAPRGLVEFGLLDDRVFLICDGRREAMLVVPREAAWNPEPGQLSPGPRALAWVGVAGDDARLQATYFEVFRDVHHWRDPILGMPGQAGGWPRHVPAGHWFLLGDSAFDSHDSRHFGPVAAAAFAGVPRAVLGPWPRARWVAP
ncbi:MAG: hypothetical protein FJ301_05270 [Planctomycetes bacterium]|nr:hypothetical protein [Planctomycetota bacterium]